VLIECRANRRAKSKLAPRGIADGGRDRAELPQHFTLKKRCRILEAKAFQCTLGEIAQHDACFVVEVLERWRRFRRRRDAPASVSPRRFPEGGEGRERYDQRARCVFFVSRDHAPALENMQQANDGLSNDRHTTLAVIPASGDDQYLLGAIDLLLAKPRLGTRCRVFGRRQRFAKVERALRAEAHLVERLSQPLEPSTTTRTIHTGNLSPVDDS
jgi:hypothetical protein